MGKYFGKQPRYSQQEAEAQAKQAIAAAVNSGRPPEEEFGPVAGRMGDVGRRPVVEIPPPPPRRTKPVSERPRVVSDILRPPPRPPPPAPAPAPKAAPAKRATRAAAAPKAAPAKRATKAPTPAKRATTKKRPG